MGRQRYREVISVIGSFWRKPLRGTGYPDRAACATPLRKQGSATELFSDLDPGYSTRGRALMVHLYLEALFHLEFKRPLPHLRHPNRVRAVHVH